MSIEVKAPIMVFREWHRHRTASYNEMSARYVPLPDENYTPSLDRLLTISGVSKQTQGSGRKFSEEEALAWRQRLLEAYAFSQRVYEEGLKLGIAKELARLPVPVARFSVMRAKANLLNWIKFLKLRLAPNAQWEIRVCAHAVAELIAEHFPLTYEIAFGDSDVR